MHSIFITYCLILEQIEFCHNKKLKHFQGIFFPRKKIPFGFWQKKLAKINRRKKNKKIGQIKKPVGTNTFEARTYGLVGKTTKLCRRNFASFVVVDKHIRTDNKNYS